MSSKPHSRAGQGRPRRVRSSRGSRYGCTDETIRRCHEETGRGKVEVSEAGTCRTFYAKRERIRFWRASSSLVDEMGPCSKNIRTFSGRKTAPDLALNPVDRVF